VWQENVDSAKPPPAPIATKSAAATPHPTAETATQ